METMVDQLISMPRIGEKAPSFTAVTTQGNINFPDDYSGKWVILLVTRQISTSLYFRIYDFLAKREPEFALSLGVS